MRFCAVLSALATFMSKYKCVTDNVLNTSYVNVCVPAFGLNYDCPCARHLDFITGLSRTDNYIRISVGRLTYRQ